MAGVGYDEGLRGEVGSLAGLRMHLLDEGRLLRRVRAALSAERQLLITFINPDYVRRALRSRSLFEDINAFGLVLVDGNGVRLAAALFGVRVPRRLDTDTVAPLLLGALAQDSARVYLFGCAPGVAHEAGKRLEQAFPGLVVVGTEHGFHDVERGHPGRFSTVDSARIVNQVRESSADLLIVSLPTPLQQRWVVEHADRLQVPIVMTAGSWLDHVVESDAFPGSWYPRWANVLRLNWFYRLLRSPRRLWRRYTLQALECLWLILRAGRKTRAQDPGSLRA